MCDEGNLLSANGLVHLPVSYLVNQYFGHIVSLVTDNQRKKKNSQVEFEICPASDKITVVNPCNADFFMYCASSPIFSL